MLTVELVGHDVDGAPAVQVAVIITVDGHIGHVQLMAVLGGLPGGFAEVGVDGRGLCLRDVLTPGHGPAVDGVGVEGLETAQNGSAALRDDDVILKAVKGLVVIQAAQVAGLVGVELLHKGHSLAAHKGTAHLDGTAQAAQNGSGIGRFTAGDLILHLDLAIGIFLRVSALEQEAVGTKDLSVKVDVMSHSVYPPICSFCFL